MSINRLDFNANLREMILDPTRATAHGRMRADSDVMVLLVWIGSFNVHEINLNMIVLHQVKVNLSCFVESDMILTVYMF